MRLFFIGETLIELNKIYQGDCLELMKSINNKSIDMILCDLPYGTTDCRWDIRINLDIIWDNYKRIIKSNCPIVLTSCQPFTSILIMSNLRDYKYSWTWNKKISGGFATAKYRPLQITEDINVFGRGKINYNPIMTQQKLRRAGGCKIKNEIQSGLKIGFSYFRDTKYPTTLLEYGNTDRRNSVHPTQKPVALFEYLIKTYTNENDLVLDNCIGSGTTAVACLNTNRNFIGMELEEKYVEIANKRIKEHKQQLVLV